MVCPCCQIANPDWALACVACATRLQRLPRRTGSVTQTSPPGAPTGQQASGVTSLSHRMVDGRYAVLGLLGRGAMGTVYKAADHKLSRLVALKIIRPELARRQEVLVRFQREFLVARQIRHPNVIRLFELGTADGLKFMSMQYVEGQSLKALLKS